MRRGDDFFILDARPRAAGNQLDDSKIESEPLPVPAPPAYPNKAFEYR